MIMMKRIKQWIVQLLNLLKDAVKVFVMTAAMSVIFLTAIAYGSSLFTIMQPTKVGIVSTMLLKWFR